MKKDIYAGAGDGFIFLAAKTLGDEKAETPPKVEKSEIIIISPEAAEELCQELPRLIALARSLKNAPAEAQAPAGQAPDSEINFMSARLVLAGLVWQGGWWVRKGLKPSGPRQAFPQATAQAYAKLVKSEVKK